MKDIINAVKGRLPPGISFDDILEIGITEQPNDYDPKRETIAKKSDFHISTVKRFSFIFNFAYVIVFYRRPSFLKRA